MAAGDDHSIFVRDDGKASSAGLNDEGQTKVPPPPGKGDTSIGRTDGMYVAAACGKRHSVMVLNNGKVVAFGRNLS